MGTIVVSPPGIIVPVTFAEALVEEKNVLRQNDVLSSCGTCIAQDATCLDMETVTEDVMQTLVFLFTKRGFGEGC